MILGYLHNIPGEDNGPFLSKKITSAEQNSHNSNCDIYWPVEENI